MNDIGLAMPIFDADRLIAIATAKGHCSDIGGMNPGSFGPGSTEVPRRNLHSTSEVLQRRQIEQRSAPDSGWQL